VEELHAAGIYGSPVQLFLEIVERGLEGCENCEEGYTVFAS